MKKELLALGLASLISVSANHAAPKSVDIQRDSSSVESKEEGRTRYVSYLSHPEHFLVVERAEYLRPNTDFPNDSSYQTQFSRAYKFHFDNPVDFDFDGDLLSELSGAFDRFDLDQTMSETFGELSSSYDPYFGESPVQSKLQVITAGEIPPVLTYFRGGKEYSHLEEKIAIVEKQNDKLKSITLMSSWVSGGIWY